jgi:hypothetical protein
MRKTSLVGITAITFAALIALTGCSSTGSGTAIADKNKA